MREVHRGEERFLLFSSFRPAGLVCGISCAPRDLRSSEDRDRVVAALGLDPSSAVWLRQKHGTAIWPAPDSAPGNEPPEGDGWVMRGPGRTLLLRAADCALVIVADPATRVVGAAHSGWRGCALGIGQILVETLTARYGSDPRNLVAAVGPTISRPRYEVGPEVPEALAARVPWTDACIERVQGRLYFDLAEANRRTLVDAGIPEASIEVAGECTFEDSRLHSYRREGAGVAHHGLIAAWTSTEAS